MILKSDTITFKVWNKNLNESFDNYADALNYAYGLPLAWLDFTASSGPGSSVTATLLVIRNGNADIIHQHYINEIVRRS
jgi:hypothetical protein